MWLELFLCLICICALLLCVAARCANRARCANYARGGADPGRFSEKIITFDQQAPHPLNYGAFETTPESAHSSLMPWHVGSLQRALLREFGTTVQSVVDATAHVGVDTANFQTLWPEAKITACEIDPAVAAATRRNMKTVAAALHAPPATVLVADGSRLRWAPADAPDLIYFDPPWGGHSAAAAARDPAAAAARKNLQLGGRPLPAVVAAALRRGARAVAVKLPRETDTARFRRAVSKMLSKTAFSLHARVHDIGDARLPGRTAYRLLIARV